MKKLAAAIAIAALATTVHAGEKWESRLAKARGEFAEANGYADAALSAISRLDTYVDLPSMSDQAPRQFQILLRAWPKAIDHQLKGLKTIQAYFSALQERGRHLGLGKDDPLPYEPSEKRLLAALDREYGQLQFRTDQLESKVRRLNARVDVTGGWSNPDMQEAWDAWVAAIIKDH